MSLNILAEKSIVFSLKIKHNATVSDDRNQSLNILAEKSIVFSLKIKHNATVSDDRNITPST